MGVRTEWRLDKAQQEMPVAIGQFGVVARASRRGRKSPAISGNSISLRQAGGSTGENGLAMRGGMVG